MSPIKAYTGQQMPAEWAEHERTIIQWPVQASMVWPEHYQEVCQAYEAVIKAAGQFEKVTLVVRPGEEALLRERFDQPSIELVAIDHNDAWARDNGPTFIRRESGDLVGINWRFNAWGEKYVPYDLDDAMAKSLLQDLQVPCLDVDLVLEGGSIHVDGQGTLLSTEECLLNENRNPSMTKSQIESTLQDQLGVHSFIWLKRGLFGDETDGHVDNIACFARPGTVLIQTCDDPEDENYQITAENMAILDQAKDATGRPIQIIEIPQPPKRYFQGQRLTLSYLNFYFVNKGILLPVFGGDAEATDKKAMEILQAEFPDRTIMPIDGMGLIKEGGNIHCITQQMPLRKI